MNGGRFFSYSAGSLPVTRLHQYNTGSGFEHQLLDSFQYSGTQLTYYAGYSWLPATSTWGNGRVSLSRYNSDGNPDTVYNFSVTAAGLLSTGYEVYSYTPDKYFDKKRYYAPNSPVVTTTTFYYEPFTPSAVEELPETADLAAIYPVPAGDVLYVRPKTGEPLAVSIYNTSGQLLLQVNDIRGMHHQLPLSGLATGTYYAVFSSATGRQSIQFVKK